MMKSCFCSRALTWVGCAQQEVSTVCAHAEQRRMGRASAAICEMGNCLFLGGIDCSISPYSSSHGTLTGLRSVCIKYCKNTRGCQAQPSKVCDLKPVCVTCASDSSMGNHHCLDINKAQSEVFRERHDEARSVMYSEYLVYISLSPKHAFLTACNRGMLKEQQVTIRTQSCFQHK